MRHSASMSSSDGIRGKENLTPVAPFTNMV